MKWILAADWMPYQRDTFVTPAFPGYVSGHSAFSRAAAEVLARITGDPFLPGGMGSFTALRNEFLEFETGPTTDVVLQWASCYEGADQAGRSRIYGGIHVPADDGPGRVMGSECGVAAWNLASKYYDGGIASGPLTVRIRPSGTGGLHLDWNATRGAFYQIRQSDNPATGGFTDLGGWLRAGETLERRYLPGPSVQGPRKYYRVIRSHEAP